MFKGCELTHELQKDRSMPQSPGRETAQIIPFPKRTAVGKPPLRDTPRDRAERGGFTLCDYGSGWYHDAALQEEEQAKLLKH